MAITAKTGDIVSFQLVANGLLGDDRNQVTVATASINYQGAKLIDPQLGVKHTALFPYFRDKVGNNDNPAAYDYMIFQGQDQLEVIGIPWIEEATFRLTNSRPVTYEVLNYREEFKPLFETFLANLGATYIFSEKK